MAQKRKQYNSIAKKLTPSGCWDNGLYRIDSHRKVSFPDDVQERAVIVECIDGVKGVDSLVTKVAIDGSTYLIAGKL